MLLPTHHRWTRHLPWLAAWLAITLLAGAVLARNDWLAAQEQFTARSEKAFSLVNTPIQNGEALLRNLAQATQAGGLAALHRLEAKMPQTHPQVISLLKRSGDTSWGDESLRLAEAASIASKTPALAHWNTTRGRFTLVLAAEPVSLAASIDLRHAIAWIDWPMAREQHTMQIGIRQTGQPLILQEGWRVNMMPGFMDFATNRPMPGAIEPPLMFEARQSYDVEDLPWSHALNAALGAALILLCLRALLRLRHDHQRAAELVQIGHADRLNSLAELAAGLSRELRGPLGTALNAVRNIQSQLAGPSIRPVDALASSMLAEEEVSHASNVIERLHQVTQRPDAGATLQIVSLGHALARTLNVLQPELRRLHVEPHVSGDSVDVLAHPDAVQQIAHNLIMNALQALEVTPPETRQLTLCIEADGNVGRLSVQDNGPGIPYETLSRVREPFFTTRADGLGLGLSLCDSLASSMGGIITVYNRNEGGAEFNLNLRLARPH